MSLHWVNEKVSVLHAMTNKGFMVQSQFLLILKCSFTKVLTSATHETLIGSLESIECYRAKCLAESAVLGIIPYPRFNNSKLSL